MLAEKLNSGAGGPVNYIEDVFSTYLYTGNGSTQTITNGIDLAGKGGLVWIKDRTTAFSHYLYDTVRGATNSLSTDSTGGTTTAAQTLTSFNSTGFSLSSSSAVNLSNDTYASWTFRKQPKFFDVVTYTGNGNTGSGQQIAHNLGSTPGCIIIKATSTTGNWLVYHRSTPSAGGAGPGAIYLNTTAASSTTNSAIGFTTDTVFSVGEGTAITAANTSGVTYVAYLFAHNAGGFGLTGTDNVISCGSFTTDASGNATVNLGYEPQWLITKNTAAGYNWEVLDTMRGFTVGAGDRSLDANGSGAEGAATDKASPTATGFTFGPGAASNTYIYIAIRRGPMKTPTTGTSVFVPTAYTGNGGSTTITAGFPVDLSMFRIRTAATGQTLVNDRLRGVQQRLFTDATTAESQSVSAVTNLASNTAVTVGANGDTNSSGLTYVSWMFRRAPSFFDEVCYSGNSTARTINHNLSAVPELMIVKARTGIARDWAVYTAATTATNFMYLNATNASGASSTMWNDTTPTASVFTVGTNIRTNNSGQDYVAYLFASCPGVSKVGSYTGTGATQTIDCGFTGGARFVLIKRTDSSGDWYVWDTARGIVAGNDPYLLLNSTAAETTTTDYIDPVSSGFEISSTAPAAINASGGTFIYLAIA